MKRLCRRGLATALLAIAVGAAASACSPAPAQPAPDAGAPAASGEAALARAFENEQSGIQVAGEGVVDRVLSDDRDGSRHQRFVLRLASGQTVLVTHNIDVAPRIPALEPGDVVAFNGVYEWNAQGGLIHWTHHDPDGEHAPGWLRYNGETFQ